MLEELLRGWIHWHAAHPLILILEFVVSTSLLSVIIVHIVISIAILLIWLVPLVVVLLLTLLLVVLTTVSSSRLALTASFVVVLSVFGTFGLVLRVILLPVATLPAFLSAWTSRVSRRII